MIPWLREFFFNETAFVGLVRAALLGLGGMVIAQPETLTTIPQWMGVIALMAGGFIRAGDKNKAS